VLRYGPLEKASLRLRVCADATFASNDDMSPQLNFTALLFDREDRCHVLTFANEKALSVVRSIKSGEFYAFADAFDAAYSLKHDVDRAYDKPLRLMMLTDSTQMFVVTTSASHTTKKRLMIDVASERTRYPTLVSSSRSTTFQTA